MSVREHAARAPARVSCFVLTVSDTRTPATDSSGHAIVELLELAGHAVADRAIVRDEPAEVVRAVQMAVGRDDVQTIITTGGTGIARRDSTFEALSMLFEKRLDGFGELFRMLSFEDIGPAAMLSRATAGVIRRRAVFMLPGSEAAVRLAMGRLIVPALGHVVWELTK
jgi:molybdenum cofactor biosynthesis protein B